MVQISKAESFRYLEWIAPPDMLIFVYICILFRYDVKWKLGTRAR